MFAMSCLLAFQEIFIIASYFYIIFICYLTRKNVCVYIETYLPSVLNRFLMHYDLTNCKSYPFPVDATTKAAVLQVIMI